jgi:glycyl-tRNA synthetase alpha chain
MPSAKAAATNMGTSRLSLNFQDLILTLHRYWAAQGCVILQP